ncbi:MAG: hypothetical protein JST11_21760 [Acidobacteria bacterium]|nr:hypothetical protein [Acidobacteriota bacterium]
MVYTCFEMVRDCRADLPQGWRYLVTTYTPVIRRLLAHYAPSAGDGEAGVERVLLGLRLPASSLFQSLDPAPERWFVAELRQAVLSALPAPEAPVSLDLETLAGALEPLTVVEKVAAWFETMHYDDAATAEMMRISPATAAKVRARAAELLRGKSDAWNRTLLADNGLALGREAAASGGKDCASPKVLLDILDGRTTWQGREVLERHVTACWHCVDHYARMMEVIALLRANRPLTDAEAAPYFRALGVTVERPSPWKRLFARR